MNSSSGSNKSWSSLFKSRAEAAAAAAAAAAEIASNSTPAQTTVNQQSKKSSTTSLTKAPLTNSVSLPNGASSSYTHSASSSSVTDQQPSLPTDVLKTLGSLFKGCELKHSAPALQPRGIRNKQNWCYVNATLQALLACPPFYNLIKTIYSKVKSSNVGLNNVPCISALGRFICEFKVMVRSANQSDQIKLVASNGKELFIGESFEIDYFYDTLANLKAELTFKSGRQEDAQEFLSFLLNRLHEEMVKCLESLNAANQQLHQQQQQSDEYANANGKSVPNEEVNHNDNNDEDEWKEAGKKSCLCNKKSQFLVISV